MSSDRIAVVADIHGNRWALEPVLEDIRRRKAESVFNLGDSLYGPLDPQGTFEILSGIDMVSVLGNEDRIILAPPERYPDRATLDHTVRSLSAEALDWLRSLSPVAVADGEFRMFHGTPLSDEEYLLRVAVEGGTVPRPVREVARLAGENPERVVLCAHDHTPQVRQLEDGRLAVDPGSVGLQAYRDDNPVPHSTGSGDARASYAFLEKIMDDWVVELVRIEYDFESAAEVASRNGREDWAAWLRSGSA